MLQVLTQLGADLALAVSLKGGAAGAPADDRMRQHAKYIWEVPCPGHSCFGPATPQKVKIGRFKISRELLIFQTDFLLKF